MINVGAWYSISIVSMVDNTNLITKSGSHFLLQLLHPNCSRYSNRDDLASLNVYVPSLSAKGESEVQSEKISRDEEYSMEAARSDPDVTAIDSGKTDTPAENLFLAEGGKKDPSLRRKELLVGSGLAENLVDVCIENAGELLTPNFGKDVIFEVAMGGSDGILHPSLDEKLNDLHEAIAALAAKPKSEESEEEHVLENFHSSHTIRN